MIKNTGLILAAALLGAFGLMAQETAKQDIKKAGGDVKEATKATGKAAKHTGKAVAKTTKKGVHKAASATEHGAEKVKDSVK